GRQGGGGGGGGGVALRGGEGERAAQERERPGQRRVLAEQDDLGPLRARQVDQGRRLRRDAVQPERLVEQLAGHRRLALVERPQGAERPVARLRRRRLEQFAQLHVTDGLVQRRQRRQAERPQRRPFFDQAGQFLATRRAARVRQRLGGAEAHQNVLVLQGGLQYGHAVGAQRLQPQRRHDGPGRLPQVLFQLAEVVAAGALRLAQGHEPDDAQEARQVEPVLVRHAQVNDRSRLRR